MVSDPPGALEVPAQPRTTVVIHMGKPAYVVCSRGGESHRGTAIHGDIDIIPPGVSSYWELKDGNNNLVLNIAPEFMDAIAAEVSVDLRPVEIRNRFQVRDPQIERIGGALQAEMERGEPCVRLYRESLATALVIQVLNDHSSLTHSSGSRGRGFSMRKLKQVLVFVEENLSGDLSIAEVAKAAGVSCSLCKILFRQSMGLPVHQYVIRRRLERAAQLLRQGQMPISQIALETGFAHQSHLARQMRRVLGISPRALQGTLQ